MPLVDRWIWDKLDISLRLPCLFHWTGANAVIYKFENFSLDADRRELRRGISLVATEPQVFDLLHYLVCNRQRVVSKDDLIGAVWNGRVISESTLSSRMTAVRHAVDDHGRDQRLIRTIAPISFRRGRARGKRLKCRSSQLR
jgi:DNA-binding winged helix-turn-helix (wHTH) protein